MRRRRMPRRSASTIRASPICTTTSGSKRRDRFTRPCACDSQLALAHVGLSYAYIELNKTAQARQAIDHSAEARRECAADHIKRHVDARALQMAAEDAPGDPSKLAAYRKSLDAAIAAFPNDVEFLLSRGIAESPDPADRGQGSVLGSIPYYERVLKKSEPSAPSVALGLWPAHHFLAHAYENAGRMKEAESSASAYAAAESGRAARRATCTATSCAVLDASTRRSRASKRPTNCSATTWRAKRSPPSSTGITRTISICWPRRINTPAR